MYWSHHHKSTNKKSSGLLTHYCLPVHIFSCPMNNIMNGKIGSWTLHLRTLHLRMLYLRHFIFGQLNLRAVKPSGSYTFGDFTFWMLHLRSCCFTFRMFHLLQLHLRRFHLREVTPLDFSPSHVFRNCGRCNFEKL